MKTASMKEHLHDRMYEVTPEMFEVLSKMVLTRRLNPMDIQLTAFGQDEGIDIEGIIDRQIVSVRFGAQVKRYSEGNKVTSGHVRDFSGALALANHQTGTYITSSSFTQPAVQTAEELQINLVDGSILVSTMLENEIGVEETHGTYEVTEEFWQAFDEPHREETVPSHEVPLANSFETLRLFLKAIRETDGSRREIDQYIDDFEARHSDLYGTAGWLLGFVHKDTPREVNGREVRCWGLTRSGVEYLELSEQDNKEDARKRLAKAVRQVEIINRIYEEIKQDGELTYDELRDKMAAETTLSKSSIKRRASTVTNWLVVLPEITEKSHGRTKKFVHN
jgi:restriction system protein